MCFHSKQSQSAQQLKNRFNASFKEEATYQPAIYNGFQYPKTLVITNAQPGAIQLFHWGLMPSWAKDDSFRKNTLNARIESIHEKPSFRNVVNNRCLILADGFYEWQWLDEKSKKKQKFEITLPNQELFGYAGIWSQWVNPNTSEVMHTYSILTTAANQLMSEIHNTKKRMPIIIDENHEIDWLHGNTMIMQNDRLEANQI
jgi:putative SOS response-associated peptidase YedK